MDKKQLLYLHFIESADPREIWIRYYRKARIEKVKMARYEIVKSCGLVPDPIKHLHDVSNDGKCVELFDNTDPREPMLSTDVPKTRTYHIAEALAVIGVTPTVSEKQTKRIKVMTEKQILDINRCSQGIHPYPDSVHDPDEMDWATAHWERTQDRIEYAYEQLSNDKVEAYAKTYPKITEQYIIEWDDKKNEYTKKDAWTEQLKPEELELQKAWNSFLKSHDNLVVEEFFETNYVRCYCTEPSIVHNESFCPRCHRPNPAYNGYVAIYHNRLLTSQDMLYLRLDMLSPDLELINVSDNYIRSQDRILHSIINKTVAETVELEDVLTIRMNNNDK
jgi:hypothetical protein